MVAGLEDIEIGETITDPENPRPLPGIRIDEPTVAMTFSVNNAPWAGREGQFVTSRKLGARIELETRRNVSIRVEHSGAGFMARAGARRTGAGGDRRNDAPRGLRAAGLQADRRDRAVRAASCSSRWNSW